jgi:MinD-like ATPase involved in chromosome partitioning or flagellar assembly
VGWNVPAEEGSQLTDPDATPDKPAHRRRAQEAVEELARMGIDPGTLGLRPADVSDSDGAPAAGGDTDAGDPQATSHSGGGVALDDAARTRAVTEPPWPVGGPAPMLPVPWPDDASTAPVRQEPDHGSTQTRPTAPVVVPNGARQAVTAFGSGLFTAGSAQRIQEEQHLVANVRTPQREHQVVVFVAGKGGVGVTTTAAGVALTVATLRDDHTALIDAQAGTHSLQRWLSDGVTSTLPDLAEPHSRPAVSPVLPLSNGLDVVDGAPWQEPTAPAKLSTLIGDLLRDHTFTFVDLGDDAGATARQTLTASTRVVVVTAADRHAARATRLTLDRIHQVQPARLHDAVVVVVCLERGQYRRVLRELRNDLEAQTTQIVPIPYEPTLAAMDQLDLSRLRAASREAYLRVAAALAAPRPPAPVIQPDLAAPPWAM